MVNARNLDAPNLTPPPSVQTAILLASVQRAVTHVETLAAATSTLSSRRKVVMTPATGETADEFVLVTGIRTQTIAPRQLIITAKDLNRAEFRLQLSPDLFVPDLLLIGDQTEGVILEFESLAGATINVVIEAATIKRAEFDAIFGRLRAIQVASRRR